MYKSASRTFFRATSSVGSLRLTDGVLCGAALPGGSAGELVEATQAADGRKELPTCCSRVGTINNSLCSCQLEFMTQRKELCRFFAAATGGLLANDFVNRHVEKFGNSRENASAWHLFALHILVDARWGFADFPSESVLRDSARDQ